MSHAGLAREVLGHRFQNPILLAAGTAGFGSELHRVVNLHRIGGVVTKSVSLESRLGNPAPRVAEFHGGMLNSIGLANPGVERVAGVDLPRARGLLGPCAIIVSVVGFRPEEYAQVVARLESIDGITAFELNLSCPNTEAGGIEFGSEAGSVRTIVAGVRSETSRPVIAKLSPVIPDIGAMAAVASGAGADGIAVVNTVPGALFHREGRPRLGSGNGGGGVSGPALLPIGVGAVRRVRGCVPGVPVIGIGGIRSADDAEQYFAAGADLVGIGTAALADPRLPERLVRTLEKRRG